MYALYVDSREALNATTRLFDEHFDPLLRSLEQAVQEHRPGLDRDEFRQYLQVCRWPFRRVEYSFVLDLLLNRLEPGQRLLDAGSGVTPLGFVLARRGVRVDACDVDSGLIHALQDTDTGGIYGAPVTYSTQDLTATGFADGEFDAIACVSVLEHIPAPRDQSAIRELLRILKPGGTLVLTVDFVPSADHARAGELRRYLQRAGRIARQRRPGEFARAARRKLLAHRAVASGAASRPRSAHQCLTLEHLGQDILPVLAGSELSTRLEFRRSLCSLSPADAVSFWNLEPGLFRLQDERIVLPAAVAITKRLETDGGVGSEAPPTLDVPSGVPIALRA